MFGLMYIRGFPKLHALNVALETKPDIDMDHGW